MYALKLPILQFFEIVHFLFSSSTKIMILSIKCIRFSVSYVTLKAMSFIFFLTDIESKALKTNIHKK